ncbi:DUF2787 family protein [Vibrio algivorus]|uniref:DUF2787 domain-containing protein n=1 Tax=Vibrio algivorus TaxID=1667024 RepID=A0A557PFM9_9VIBR|nr:DUF2787 family protein [Vibrio algivorus]TVO39434.1 DUF2787 domain-containing protein [Vibrio algivorus]
MAMMTINPISVVDIHHDLKGQIIQSVHEQLAKNSKQVLDNIHYVTIRIKDSQYSAQLGGLRPVEIALKRRGIHQWELAYISVYGYLTPQSIALTRWLDFDFQSGKCLLAPKGDWQKMDGNPRAVKLYHQWESAFLSAITDSQFDEVKVMLIG